MSEIYKKKQKILLFFLIRTKNILNLNRLKLQLLILFENNCNKIYSFINSINNNIINILQTNENECERMIALEFAQEIVKYSNGLFLFINLYIYIF